MKLNINKPLWNFETNTFEEGQEVFIDKYLYSNIEIFVKRLIHDFDTWVIISGDEGEGKSLLGKQIASMAQYLLNIEKREVSAHIVFDPNTFIKVIKECKKSSIIIFDEATTGLHSRKSMSNINIGLISAAAQYRKKNLFVIIILPAFHDLDKNIAIHRTRCLLNVYVDKFKRGFFSYFTKEQKRKLYVDGKKYYDMRIVKPEFRGRYMHWSSFDELEYEKQKDESIGRDLEVKEVKNKWLRQRNASFYLLERSGMTHAQISHELMTLLKQEVPRNTISDAIRGFSKEMKGDGETEI